jgi:Flp pilus assembly protein TadD
LKISFLHIGKTGGNSLREMLTAATVDTGIDFTWCKHDTTLRKLMDSDAETRIGLVFRDPAERFVSAFWSRMRMGRPRNNSLWSAEEAIAFKWFATPNELAEALSGDDPRLYSAALFALEAISHLRRNMAWVLGTVADMQRARDRLHFVCPLEQLDRRLPKLLATLGISGTAASIEHLHVRPEGRSHADELSAKGLQALRKHWQADYDLYDYCLMHYGGEAGATLRTEADAAAEEALERYRTGEYEAALVRIDLVLRLKPSDRRMLLIKARAMSALARVEDAEDAWRRVLDLEADNIEAMVNLGRMRYRARDLPEATVLLSNAASIAPDDANVRRLRIAVAEAGSDFELLGQLVGVDLLTDAELGRSDDWQQAINMRMQQGDLQKAEAICRVKLESGDDDRAARMALARVLVRQDRLVELEELLQGEKDLEDHIALLGMVRAALARKDIDTAQHRLAALKKRSPSSTGIVEEEARIALLRKAIACRDLKIEADRQITAILGVSFCGSTVLGSMLGSLSDVEHVGESHRMIKSARQDAEGNANTWFNWDQDDAQSLTPCHGCGPDCSQFDTLFRRRLSEAPENWFFQLAERANVRHLVSGDKHMAQQLDRLERYKAIILFKSPLDAFRSNWRRRQVNPSHTAYLTDGSRYAETWAAAYRLFLHGSNPENGQICLDWTAFQRSPERHLERLCDMLGLPFDKSILTHRKTGQHSFGGNAEVRAVFAEAPALMAVRGEEDTDLPQDETAAVASHKPAQMVHAQLQERYRSDFGDMKEIGTGESA